MADGKAKLEIYTSTVDSEKLLSLRAMLSDPKVLSLREYLSPAYPLTISQMELVDVRIIKPTGEFHVGYLYNPFEQEVGQTTNNQIQWRQTRDVLQPIISWIDSLPVADLTPSSGPPNACSAP